MAKTLSTMLPLGTEAPSFSLQDAISGKLVSLDDYNTHKAIVIMFICNHCPYVKHIQKKLVEVAKIFHEKEVGFVAINSNDINAYPEDHPDKMRLEAKANHYFFPYLFDETQEIAKAYQAACTPDFYIFNQDKKCAYRGRFDDSTPGNGIPVTGKDLINALKAIVTGKSITIEQMPSIGCNIKWKN